MRLYAKREQHNKATNNQNNYQRCYGMYVDLSSVHMYTREYMFIFI